MGKKVAAVIIQKVKNDAKTQVEKAKIQAEIDEVNARRAVIIAEAGSRLAGGLNASMRFLLTLGPLAILLKLFFWDKVVGSFVGCAGRGGILEHCNTFRTDPLDTNQWAVIAAAIGFYFVTSIFKK